MLKKSRSVIFVLLLFSFLFPAYVTAGDQKKAENFTLEDYNGKSHSLSDYKKAKAIVLVFVSTQCPVSNAYNDRMESLFNEFRKKNVEFIGINSNKEEMPEEIKEHARKHNLNFTILKDKNNLIADKLGARVTPEAYLLDKNFEILYHGRIDDSRSGEDIENQDLRNAINDLLSGKKISVAEAKAFGCTIKRVKGAME
ncbi:MAG: thioredoxin family protein [Bacillota bacterium]